MVPQKVNNLRNHRRNETIAEVSYEGGDSETPTSQNDQTII